MISVKWWRYAAAYQTSWTVHNDYERFGSFSFSASFLFSALHKFLRPHLFVSRKTNSITIQRCAPLRFWGNTSALCSAEVFDDFEKHENTPDGCVGISVFGALDIWAERCYSRAITPPALGLCQCAGFFSCHFPLCQLQLKLL